MPSEAVMHTVPAELLGHDHADPRAAGGLGSGLIEGAVKFVAVDEHRDRPTTGGGRPGNVVRARLAARGSLGRDQLGHGARASRSLGMVPRARPRDARLIVIARRTR